MTSWGGNLTPNAISSIYHGQTDLKPLLQIIDLKKIPPSQNNPNDRFRIVLSDSVDYQQAMLTSQLNEMCYNNRLSKYNIVQLEEYLVNEVGGRKVIIILNVTVIAPGPQQEIGNPQNVEKKTAAGGGGGGGARPNPYARSSAPSSSRPSYNQSAPNQARGGGGGGGGGGGFGGGSKSYNMPQNTMTDAQVCPVQSLNPYRNRWVIKVRCTSKGDVRHWKNDRGEGKLMSVDLLDKQGCEIRCTMFKEAVDKFEPLLQVDKVYFISKGKIKVANKKWTHIPHDYEITLDKDAQVEIVHEDDNSIKQMQYNFVTIADIANTPENTFVDIVGIVKHVDELRQIESQKAQRTITKRSITIGDRTGTIDLTMWAQTAEKYDEEALKDFPVMAVKAARVSDYGGKSLSLSQSSVVSIRPDCPEGNAIKGWWDSEGQHDQQGAPSLTAFSGGKGISANDPVYTFADIKGRDLGRNPSGKPDYFVVKGTITSIRHDVGKVPWYKSCGRTRDGKTCNKKVVEEGSEFRCIPCNAVGPGYTPRLILGFAANDHSGSHYLNCFDDIGQLILGKDAQFLDERVTEGDEGTFNRVFKEANFRTKLFKLRAKTETYEDEERVKCNVIGMEDLDFVKGSYDLINSINSLG